MKEKDIQKMVVQWLQMNSLTADNFFSIPNEGKRSLINGKSLVSMGLKKGASDIFIMIPTRIYSGMFLEIKREKGSKTSPEQIEFMNKANSQGYYACIGKGFDNCIAEITNYLKTI